MSQARIKLRPLQTTGSAVINLEGLNPEDRLRIKKVGFDRWLDEVSKAQEKRIARGSL